MCTTAFYPLAPELSRALGSANALVVELPTHADAVFRRAVRIPELESADYQLALFDTLGNTDGERNLRDALRDALRELADGSALRKARAVMAAWRSGDGAACCSNACTERWAVLAR